MSVVIIALGTSGYIVIEGWSFFDALYMTVITFSTVGYGEIRQLSTVGRIYTTCIIFLGVGFFMYVAAAVVQFMVEGEIRTLLGRRRLDSKIKKLKKHYIVCGYGRIGRVLCKKLKQRGVDLVVIEKDPEQTTIMEEDSVLYITGEATDERLLKQAGIEDAAFLVAALATDIDNVFLVLTARQLNPKLYIMARAGRNESKSKLLSAGANKVESPYDMGAVSMANRLLRPTVTNFLDLALAEKNEQIQMEEIPISAESPLVNVMLKDSGIRQNYNLIIIAVKQEDGSMIFNPSFETVLKVGDTVIAIGEIHNLQRFEKVLNPVGNGRYR